MKSYERKLKIRMILIEIPFFSLPLTGKGMQGIITPRKFNHGELRDGTNRER